MIISLAFTLFGAFLSFKYFDGIVIFGTAFIGAYSLIRGTSLIFGHYPNEWQMILKLANGETENVPYQFFIYLVSFVILFVVGTIYQIKMKRKERENFIKVA
jgi:uncharacterized membrane protein